MEPLSQKMFEQLVCCFFAETGISMLHVEKDSFRKLVTYGPDRRNLKTFGRFTLKRRLHAMAQDVVRDSGNAALSAAGKVNITFDMWTCIRNRGYLAVTGHFFDRSLCLQSLLLAFAYLPKAEQEGRHTSQRIYDCIHKELAKVFRVEETEVHQHLGFAVTDGAPNVTNAAIRLVGPGARRCFQHALQLVLKYFCLLNTDVKMALAAANYMAKLSKSSQVFAHHLGAADERPFKIPAGVPTRWNYYLICARAVVLKQNQILTWSALQHDGVSDAFRSALRILTSDGFACLTELCNLLEPLCDMTIDLEGEFYISISAVVPRLLENLARIEKEFSDALQAEPGRRRRMQGWKHIFDGLVTRHLSAFLDDNVCLAATLLDVRFSVSSLDSFPVTQSKAVRALKALLDEEYEKSHPRDSHAAADQPLQPCDGSGSGVDASNLARLLGFVGLQLQQEQTWGTPPCRNGQG